MKLYPLRFEPLLRRYIWGGRRLATLLGKSLPAGEDFAESWELVDHQQGQSVVQFGPLQGLSLHDLCQRFGEELLGAGNGGSGFPLLFKFIDAQQDLSLQVHPDDQAAATLDPPDRGKTEAWVVLHADPDSRLYAGLRPGVDRQRLETELSGGDIEKCLQCFRPQPGDCFLIKAGLVHAIGSGLVIAEIQQSSDTTFRLHDWNRVGADGQPRPLHLEQALEVIDFEAEPIVRQDSIRSDQENHVERLSECEKFVLDRCSFQGKMSVGGDGKFHILVMLRGQVEMDLDPSQLPLQSGQVCLIPAETGPVELVASEAVTWLDIYLP